MTDMTIGSSQGQDASASQPVAETPSTQTANLAPAETQQERTFKQQELNDIVGRAKAEAVERFKREISQQSSSTSTTAQPTENDFRRMAAEEARRLLDERNQDAQRIALEQDAQRTATEFFTKLSTGKQKYDDFDSVIGNIEFQHYGNAVHLANQFENCADIFYELSKDPIKLEAINGMAAKSPKAAYAAMQKLAQSIKDNEQGSKVRRPNEPLDRMKPSNTGTDNGVMSVRDYRKRYQV